MSHHFDTKLAREDPSLNICDFYLFDGPRGKTVMAMTVNPDTGLSASDMIQVARNPRKVRAGGTLLFVGGTGARRPGVGLGMVSAMAPKCSEGNGKRGFL
jgi:hypothetical protein